MNDCGPIKKEISILWNYKEHFAREQMLFFPAEPLVVLIM